MCSSDLLGDKIEGSREALQRIERELSLAAGGAEIRKDLAPSRAKSGDSQDPKESESHATLLLRRGFEALMESEMRTKSADSGQPKDQKLVIKKDDLDCSSSPSLIGRGGGIRTHDLFVPNEAR